MAEQQAKQKRIKQSQGSGVLFSRFMPHKGVPVDLPLTTPTDQPSAAQKSKPWRWSLVWLAILGICGGMGTSALLWLVTLPPPPNCSNPAQLTLDGERLYCAHEAARTGELSQVIAGLDLIKQWDTDHPLQGEAQKLREEWSKRLFTIAQEKVDQSDMKGAMAIISHIPKNTEMYADVQKTVVRWKKQWQAGEAIATKAQLAMKQQKWDEAYSQISLLNDSQYDYWLKRAGVLAQQVGAEKQARQVFNQAKKLAAGGEPGQLAQAIALGQQVPTQTYVAAEAQVQLKQWSHTLLGISIGKWKQGDTTTAATLLRLPAGVISTPEIEELFQFGGAYRLAGRISSRWLPSLNQIWDLQEAIAAIRQVKPESPFYQVAQTHQKNWQTQLQDLIQLQYATATATLGQRDSLKLAIAQAQQIRANRPRYGQAQTLISYWVGEVQRLEDQPYLVRAEQFAQSGEIPALKAAIAEASKIAQGRSLRGRSQDLIATWQDQIETIEDQPTLNQAFALAHQGDLTGAIDRARQIQEGRALYAKAQGLIDDWQTQLIMNAQIAVDRPILDRASALASNGDLTLAINLASQIYSGRALYGEAQDAIARWRSQRDILLNPRPTDAQDSGSGVSPTDSPTVDPNFPEPSPTDSSASPTEPDPLPSIELVDPSTLSSPPESSEPESDSSPIIVPTEPAESEPRLLRPRASYEGYYDQRYYQNSQ